MTGPFPRAARLELLDRLDDDRLISELGANLRDIRRSNRYLGGTQALLNRLRPYLDDTRPVSLLDVATGSADIPIIIARRAARHHLSVSIVATDIAGLVLDEARRQVERSGLNTIRIERADALALPYYDAEFDLVTCSLALHHFDPRRAVIALSEMHRVARRAVFVNDLERSRLAWVGAWLLAHGAARNRLTRHDAPLSVRRAYTKEEILGLCRHAGWQSPRFTRARFFRMVVWSEVDAESPKA
jgi:ubiquinone/menaquinone biosynthesis C-methylase UbiE